MKNNVYSYILLIWEYVLLTCLTTILTLQNFIYLTFGEKEVRQWHHQLTHLLDYSHRMLKKCFVKNCKTSQFNIFVIFIQFSSQIFNVFLKMFTLSSEFTLNLNCIWPLKLLKNYCPEILSVTAGGFGLIFKWPVFGQCQVVDNTVKCLTSVIIGKSHFGANFASYLSYF